LSDQFAILKNLSGQFVAINKL